LASDIRKELDAYEFSFGHFTLILLLHYLVKCRSRSLAIDNNEFILDRRMCCLKSDWPKSHKHDWQLLYLKKSHVSRHILLITACAQNVFQRECKRQTLAPLTQTAGSTTSISQGSAVTVLKWDGQNYSHLFQVSSWCCTPKIIKIGPCCTELFKK